ncbi:MAG: PspC domain-containing protein [Spirochaetales bacterium]|nr:PspC domain-containing protein [Spirochaetales bacterium]
MATRRLYRSRHGEWLGVCKGIAEWRDLPVDTVRLILILIAIFTAIVPCLIIYFVIGLLLPVNPYDDDSYERGYDDGRREGRRDSRKGKGKTYYYNPEPEDFVSSEAKAESDEEYERRKKESDWDNRFSNS